LLLLGGGSSVEEVEDFVLASTQLAMQLLSPFVRESHAVSETTMASTALQTWIDLDRTLHLCLVANGQACRASLYQGQGLLRVAKTLLPHHQLFQDIQQHMATKNFAVGHFATVFGLLSKELGISPRSLFCVAVLFDKRCGFGSS
jgi:urease accessory protein UreF